MQVFEVLDGVNVVAIERKYAEALVALKPFDLLDVVAVQNEGLEEDVAVGILDLVDRIASVVDPLKVGRWVKVECLSDLVPSGLELDQVLQMGEIL